MSLGLGLSGPDLGATLRVLAALPAFAGAPPSSLSVDRQPREPSPDWVERWVAGCETSVVAYWGEGLGVHLVYHRDRIVYASFPFERDAESVLALLSEIPFEIASFRTLHPEWLATDPPHLAPSFGRLHIPHGWACAFKAGGHDQLVSRRWLDYGPWRVLRGGDDLSLVQFHDLDADAAAALAQAAPAHARMGITDTGGFIQSDYVYLYGLEGLYDAATRLLKVVVHGREVSQRELLDACAARRYRALGPARPLDNIAYVFLEESNALSHLHELWLRELQCLTIREGLEVRLDAEYDPARRAR